MGWPSTSRTASPCPDSYSPGLLQSAAPIVEAVPGDLDSVGVSTPFRYARYLLRSTARTAVNRARIGGVRARRSVLPAAQMTAAGVGAYIIAEQLLGHQSPVFAAVAALIALGFSKEPRLRKVIEVAVGCTLGILIADLLVHTFGAGVVTAVVVVFLSVMLARFLNPGPVLALQMGLQSLLVVMLPAPDDSVLGPVTRSVDAVVGGSTALLVALLTPQDPRGEPIRALRQVSTELTHSLRETAAGLRTSDSREMWHALIRSRGIQTKIDEVNQELTSTKELVIYSPAHRRHRHYVRRLEQIADKLDLAVRSLRVLTRRAISAIDEAALSDTGTETLARLTEDLADASVQLSRAVKEPGAGFKRNMATAQDAFIAVARVLHPRRLEIQTLQGEALVLLTRTMVIDLLEATGLDHEEAVEHLPDL